MTIKIGGWSRIGVVLSVLWFLAIGGYGAYEYSLWDDNCRAPGLGGNPFTYHDPCSGKLWFVEWKFVQDLSRDAAFEYDLLRRQHKTIPEDVMRRLESGPEYEKQFKGGIFLFLWLVPVIAMWILVYVCVSVFRWIRRGF